MRLVTIYLHLCEHHVLAAFSEREPSCLLHTYFFFPESDWLLQFWCYNDFCSQVCVWQVNWLLTKLCLWWRFYSSNNFFKVLVLHMPFLFFCDNVNFVYETPVANLCSFPYWIRLYSFTILLQDYGLIPDLVCWLEYVSSCVTSLYIRDS